MKRRIYTLNDGTTIASNKCQDRYKATKKHQNREAKIRGIKISHARKNSQEGYYVLLTGYTGKGFIRHIPEYKKYTRDNSPVNYNFGQDLPEYDLIIQAKNLLSNFYTESRSDLIPSLNTLRREFVGEYGRGAGEIFVAVINAGSFNEYHWGGIDFNLPKTTDVFEETRRDELIPKVWDTCDEVAYIWDPTNSRYTWYDYDVTDGEREDEQSCPYYIVEGGVWEDDYPESWWRYRRVFKNYKAAYDTFKKLRDFSQWAIIQGGHIFQGEVCATLNIDGWHDDNY
jgi:hypothetical protein